MIDINSPDCIGCGACESVCPQNCIALKTDNEGFLYPVVDDKKCTDCHQCENICIINNDIAPIEIREAYAVYSKNEKERLRSSSGAVFYELSRKTIDGGGVVFGAAFSDDWSVTHTMCTSLDELHNLQTSKYVQSETSGIFEQVKSELHKEKTVLFCGTPCQCNALSLYLKKSYSNLLLVDFICHGVPSPGVWQKYVHSFGFTDIQKINFRNKSKSWENYCFSVCNNGKEYTQKYIKNPYMRLFLFDLILRKSCYRCKSKIPNKKADITAADLWGAEKIASELNDHKGLSMVVINSSKGADFFEGILDSCIYKKIDITAALSNNESSYKSVTIPECRNKVIEQIISSDSPDFDKIAKKNATQPLPQRILAVLKSKFNINI